jgi:SAM-dependent methyltransferase
MIDYSLGCQLPVDEWVHLNRTAVFNNPALRDYVSPFPPKALMQNTTGLTDESDFASHGADFWIAFSEASPKPLSAFASILDFGCGCGRLARMFKGHPGNIVGCDIDYRHIAWCTAALEYMETKLSSVRPPIPFADNEFEAVISLSVFTHLNESSQDQFLQELARVCRPAGFLFLTIHGNRALNRAVSEPSIKAMLNMQEDLFMAARKRFAEGQHAFIMQQGHLTTVGKPTLKGLLTDKVISDPFEYGITFIPENYVRTHWTEWFDMVDYRVGALHDFQDIVVLKPKK